MTATDEITRQQQLEREVHQLRALVEDLLAEAKASAGVASRLVVNRPVFVQMHTGWPGRAGRFALASVTRRETTLAVRDDGAAANTTEISWEAIPKKETWTHFTLWDSPEGGNRLDGNRTGGGLEWDFVQPARPRRGETVRFAIGTLALGVHKASPELRQTVLGERPGKSHPRPRRKSVSA